MAGLQRIDELEESTESEILLRSCCSKSQVSTLQCSYTLPHCWWRLPCQAPTYPSRATRGAVSCSKTLKHNHWGRENWTSDPAVTGQPLYPSSYTTPRVKGWTQKMLLLLNSIMGLLEAKSGDFWADFMCWFYFVVRWKNTLKICFFCFFFKHLVYFPTLYNLMP